MRCVGKMQTRVRMGMFGGAAGVFSWVCVWWAWQAR